MIFYCHNDKDEILQKIQNKFTRLAYQCRLSTPMHTLEMIAKIEPLTMRYDKLIFGHCARAKY